MMGAREPRAGFTLLELLVSMALLGLLGLLLGGAFHMATTHVGRRQEALDRSAELVATEAFLRERLAAAIPAVPQGWGEGAVLFDGEADGLSFVAPAPDSVPAGGFLVYTIVHADDGLVLRWRPYDGTVPEGPGTDTLLLPGVREARFAYHGARDGDAPAWHGRWKEQPALPALVRLALTDGDGRPLPDLVVAPRVGAP